MSTKRLATGIIKEARQQTEGLNCAVDWLTATSDERDTGFAWYEVLKAHQKALMSTEGRYMGLKEMRVMMYDGVDFEGLYWGQSKKQGFIMIAKGDVAEKLWSQIVPGVKNISRVDLSVTAHLGAPVKGVAGSHYLTRTENVNRKYRLIVNSSGGETLDVGSRQSNFCGRCYDKSAERGDPPGWSWRYEVECKSPNNTAMMSSLLRAWQKGYPVAEDIGVYVHKWFKVRGVSPIFTPRLLKGNVLETDAILKVTSADRSLTWLRTQVAPTIARLIDAGYLGDVLPALGLTYKQLGLNGGMSVPLDERTGAYYYELD